MNLRDQDNPLPLPVELLNLADKGLWPGVGVGANSEILKKVDWEKFAEVFPDETDLLFKSPPFKTVSKQVSQGNYYWTMAESMISQIDPEKTVVIGGFGHGSDTVIALDYREDVYEPSVIKLQWADVEPKINNRWVRVASSFREFCEIIGLLR